MEIIAKLSYDNNKVDYNNVVILVATTRSFEVALNNRNRHIHSDVSEVR
jgi:hypothetical protein